MAEASGITHLVGMVEGVTMRMDANPDTGVEEVVVTEHKQDLHPQITVVESDPKTGKAVLAADPASGEKMEKTIF